MSGKKLLLTLVPAAVVVVLVIFVGPAVAFDENKDIELALSARSVAQAGNFKAARKLAGHIRDSFRRRIVFAEISLAEGDFKTAADFYQQAVDVLPSSRDDLRPLITQLKTLSEPESEEDEPATPEGPKEETETQEKTQPT